MDREQMYLREMQRLTAERDAARAEVDRERRAQLHAPCTDRAALLAEIEQLKENLRHPPPCNCDLSCEDFVTLHKLLTYLRNTHKDEAAWKEYIAALARTIRVDKRGAGGHGH